MSQQVLSAFLSVSRQSYEELAPTLASTRHELEVTFKACFVSAEAAEFVLRQMPLAAAGSRAEVDSSFAKLLEADLGLKVRALLEAKGFKSVAAPGFQAPCVVVSYTKDPDIQNGKKFMALGMQTAAGVPLQVGEREDFRTFRIGLFGLEKLLNIDRTVGHLSSALDRLH
jgi:hypothetical protein